ncbi:exodeoxyribonuclease III [Emticicia sp. 21SJ11W-3]|uniref:exodeoxyribonuclease III n=1 Tax=Emticicia sp. 21SJ11W-3 TaxID=2916755 RepID=UPI0020A192B7|nr:exodeoxyribonuclease III [Emticicia sp. 21SJ11W-3]UTA68206.1 exodeoxyribonuclease III [Emticicia sp. 21SJ11W-3]
MKIISYNVNGIRAAINKGLLDWLKITQPDAICLQEIKISETELIAPAFEELGFHCYWFPAQKRGYSGVAILTKIRPKHVEYGIGIAEYDFEGRVIRADYDNFSLLCAYFPSGTTGDIRQTIKMKFLDDFFIYVQKLNEVIPNLIVSGDVNICHTEIDIHNPKSNANSSGFLPEERAWVGKFIENGYIDTFRFFNKDPHHYTWWSYRAGARAKNLGWRIDYHFASKPMEAQLKSALIHPDLHCSDHCPIELCIDFN